ncbi:MAG: hypothetical protein KGJ30_15470, partial [Burkholderiales bacterium]|nr:hypothetical protein [Burkholderiales bacterium]
MRRPFLAGFFLLCVAAQAIAYPLTPENVAADLVKRNPATVIADLSKSGRYDKILNRLGRGQQKWISLAPALAKGTDAGTSESLVFALATALPNNPRAVLSILKAGDSPLLTTDQVCSPPMIEPTKRQLSSYFKRTIAGLSRVTGAELS